ncbi:MAG: arginine--tRNA ligase [Clostridiales bacterium]|nr:arginine--tRNA ligase [Clostridiales bacterium]
MSQIVEQTKQSLRRCILEALGRAVAAGALPAAEIPDFNIEVPGNPEHGDYSANVAMVSARAFRMAPAKIAAAVQAHLDLQDTLFEQCQIAGPGFLNFYLGDRYYAAIVRDVMDKGDAYGRSDYGNGKKYLVEFVSANPTGPMHIGNARGGAIGDCLASVLDWAGYQVEREFYVNDAGNQIEKFATSLETRYLQLFDRSIEMPEDAYQGADIIEHAEAFRSQYGDAYVTAEQKKRRDALVEFALPKNIEKLETDLMQYRIRYDTWFRESSMYQDGSVDRIIQALKDSGHTYEQEGALWFRATDFGVDKDFVLVRANGFPTYIVPDIAYHYNKLITRGFDKAIDIWGADHHGYVPRMKAALTALGIDSGRLDIVIMQMVRLVRGGETIKASKRSGKAITLLTLLEEVPVDAARFYFNLREANSHFDFDLDQAVAQDSQNPVYYVQYAHARICSILRKVQEDGVVLEQLDIRELTVLNTEEERSLIRHLAALTGEVVQAAKDYNPARMTHYVMELATLFHKFYNACRVVSEDKNLMQARLTLCICVQNVIRNILTMLNISAPEQM